MVKELLLAILAFSVTALVIIILMTAVGDTLFPSAVSILENRLERIQPAETAPPSPVSPPPEPPVPESTPAPTVPRPAPEPAPDAPEPITDVPPGDGSLAEKPETPAPDADEREASPASRTLTEDLTDDLAPGGILPLSDGRVAYKVQSGDTFSQICKKVVGTGRQQVWQKAAEMMDIDYRTIRPGSVLIFDAAVLALGEEE